MEAKLRFLKQRFSVIYDLKSVNALLGWDQSTYMPRGGATARAGHLATLAKVTHEKLTDPAVGDALEGLTQSQANFAEDSDEAGFLRAARREYERAAKLPADFVAEMSAHTAASYEAWAKARAANDFKAVRPYLEKTLELSRAYAGFFPGHAHIADPLIELGDEGMTVATIRPLFTKLRKQLLPLLNAISQCPKSDTRCLAGPYPQAQQRRFSEAVIQAFGYDFDRGRLDKTLHPFMTKFSLNDVRITTRYKEDDLSEGLFSTLHEAGHALYELNIDQRYEGTPLASGTSSGVHESQSRLWENLVGRSLGFWKHYYPKLQDVFPQQLGQVPLETFYRAINHVEPSLIRTDADEVSYNLHVMVRFDLELALLEGKLTVADLPQAWNARYQTDLGVAPPDDVHGVLQDVHWYAFFIGGQFQGYTLGNVISAQLFDAARTAHPQIDRQIEQGKFDTLRGWLRDHVHRFGKKYNTHQIVERATGQPLTIAPYVNYLTCKYGELYGF